MSFAERYGPWAIIAGASEGTGRAFARQIAREGINCILLARRLGPLDALAGEIREETGVEVMTASVDLAAAEASQQIAALAEGKEVGLYISNAGADPNGTKFLDTDLGAWLSLVERNILTTLKCCHHFGRAMKDRGHGGILLVGSGGCYISGPNLATYSGAKAFDMMFAEGLWAELEEHGVDVLYLAMTQTDTPAYRAYLDAQGRPYPEAWANPADVAREGLSRLPHGPVHHFGVADDERGFAPLAAAERRGRVRAIFGVGTGAAS